MKLRVMICAMAASAALFATDNTSDTFGLVRVTDTSTNTVIGVPWVGATGSAISLSNLVSTATLSAGDVVYLYEGETWKAYKLSANKVWEPYTTVGVGGTEGAPSADSKTLARGTGLVIQRASADDSIYLCGRLDTTTPSATAIAANSTVLFANPLTSTKTISSEGANGDKIIVLKNGGGSTIYQKKDGAWGTYVETTTTTSRGTKKTQTWTTGCTLAPGMGAWYQAGGAAASISWAN